MSKNILFDRLREGDICLGLGLSYGAPGLVEGMCKGWDFVWVDGQHGALDYAACLGAIHASAGVGVETVLRVPGHEFGIIGPMMDLAPSALMVPMVDTPEQAQSVVESTRFPPLGKRSYGGRRVIDVYGREYVRERETMVIAQIETLEAVACADKIIGTEGIDMLFFGPDDAKVRLNLPMSTGIYENDRLREAMQQTAKAAVEAGKLCGTVAGNQPAIEMAMELGYRCFVCGSDISMLRTAAAAQLETMRAASTQDSPSPGAAPGGGGGAY
jgi:4-hydroxy-2-oxoheptanedioate aldolase